MAARWQSVLAPILAGGSSVALPDPPAAPLLVTAAPTGVALAEDAPPLPALQWIEAYTLGLSGQAVFPPSLPRASPYDRFPAAFEDTVEAEVWQMSRWGSGQFLLFESDSPRIWLNITLQVPYRHYEALMPETGHSGCDIYTYDNATKTWLWIGSNFPAFGSGNATLVGEIFSDGADNEGAFWRPNVIPREFFASPRHYMVYLPLYNGPTHMSVGINTGSFARPDEWSTKTFCEKRPVSSQAICRCLSDVWV